MVHLQRGAEGLESASEGITLARVALGRHNASQVEDLYLCHH